MMIKFSGIWEEDRVMKNTVVLSFWYKFYAISVHWQTIEFGGRRKSKSLLQWHVTDFKRLESSF